MCTPTRHLPSPKASTDSASSKSRAVGGSMLNSLNSNRVSVSQLEGQFHFSIFKATTLSSNVREFVALLVTKMGV